MENKTESQYNRLEQIKLELHLKDQPRLTMTKIRYHREKCNTLSADQKRRKHESLEEDCRVTEINRLQNDSTQCMFDFMQPDGITATTLESIVDNERFGSQ